MSANPALVAGRLAPLVVLGVVPKCGLCVVAWGAALAGIGAEACGSGDSWTILGSLIARRLGLSVGELDALFLASAASGAAVYLWLMSKLSR